MNRSKDSALSQKTRSKSNEEEDPLAAEKKKLEEQIAELKSLISEIESNLDIPKFKDIKPTFSSEVFNNSKISKARNTDLKLQAELHKFGGLACVKFLKGEYVFHLSSAEKITKENTYAVQILNKDGVGSLGKWVMPEGVDIEELATKIPLKELKNIPAFLKACKNYVDCYYCRQQQFQALMEIVSTMKRCKLQATPGYTRVTLDLLQVQHVERETYMDIVVYLMYNIEEARPFKIEVDSRGREELDEQTAKHLKSCFKCFKSADLKTGFEKMFNDGKGSFTWEREQEKDNREKSPTYGLSSSSDEEHGYLEQSISNAGVKRKLKEKNTQRKKRSLSTSQIEKEQFSIEGRSVEENESMENESTMNNTSESRGEVALRVQKTPLHKDRGKLKQRKLRFNLERNERPSSSIIKPIKKGRKGKQSKLLTSTPLHENKRLISSSSFDVSDITPQTDSTKSARGSKIKTSKSQKLAKGRKQSVGRNVK